MSDFKPKVYQIQIPHSWIKGPTSKGIEGRGREGEGTGRGGDFQGKG